MGRAPCCDKANVKRGPWSPEEDATLKTYLNKNGTGGNWISLPQRAGLKRCGKSCRLRWLNYLRPDIKHGPFTDEEDNIIISLYSKMGSRWSVIAANLAGRTDNDVKNHWNTKLKKMVFGGGRLEKISNKLNPIINNLTFTNPPLNFQLPTSPSPSPPPTYLDNPNYSANLNHNHHQFYVTHPSFCDLLSQCTSNVTLPSGGSTYNPIFSILDHPSSYVYCPMMIANSSSPRYMFDQYVSSQVRLTSQCSSTLVTPQTEVSSITSNLDDDQFLSELGFGLIQQVMSNSTSNYGDQEDIKPQGLDKGVSNY